MENGIKVLFLDDDLNVLKSVSAAWRSLGIEVETAQNTEGARSALLGHEDEYDVMVLDMLLGSEAKTGADFGIEVRERVGSRSPECLILSAYDYQEYYQKAFLLGAAGYLRKPEYTQPSKIAPHLRALALRKVLRNSGKSVRDRLIGLARAEDGFVALVERFCRELLAPELTRVLSSDFILLLSSEEKASKLHLSSGEVLPGGRGLREIEGALSSNLAGGGRLVVGNAMSELARQPDLEPPLKSFLERSGSAFCQLFTYGSVRLTLGLLQAEPAVWGRPVEEAGELALAIRRYLHPTVTDPLVGLLAALSKATAEARKAREISASFCLALAQEVSLLAEDLEPLRQAGDERIAGVIVRLEQLGDELNDSGQLLDDLSVNAIGGEPAGRKGAAAPSSLRALVQEVWDEMVEYGFAPGDVILRLLGDATATFRRDRVRRALNRLLGWLVERMPEPGGVGAREIEVRFADSGEYVELVLENQGPRLARELRAKLFEPQAALTFSARGEKPIGLYLTHELLASEHFHLEDRSDEISGEENGHRFVISQGRPD
jgi:DNA-binding NarL/FixJ family response regulator